MRVLQELDKTRLDEAPVMNFVDKVLVAGNNVAKEELVASVRFRKLLAYLEAQQGGKGVE